MKIIGFTHPRNELEQAKRICEQRLKEHVLHYVIYEITMTVLMLFGSICFFGMAYWIAACMLSSSTLQSDKTVRGLLLLGVVCLFAWFMHVLYALICRILPHAVREGYQTYEHWLDIQCDLRLITNMYDLYEALAAAGEKVWLNQTHTAIMYVMPPEREETLPIIKKKVLTDEMEECLLKDNCITFAYYNEYLTKIQKEVA